MIFEIEGQDADTGAIEVSGERMWVIVSEKVGDTYIGVLDNLPATIELADDVYLRTSSTSTALPMTTSSGS